MHLLTTLITGVVVVSGWFSGLIGAPRYGATIATTALSDTIGTFRTNVNTSLENLNTELGNVSSTIHAYGSIVSVDSPVPVANGGTATTSVPSAGQLLIGNGSGYSLGSIAASGTKTHVYNSAGAIAISSDEVDEADSYSWTGGHTFASSVVVTGNSTLASTTITGMATFASSASFAVSPTAPAPSAATDVANKAYVDLKMRGYGSTTIDIGDNNSSSTVTGGFVSGYAFAGPSGVCQLIGYVDSSSTPTVKVAADQATDDSTISYASVGFPVPAGMYYAVDFVTGGGSCTYSAKFWPSVY